MARQPISLKTLAQTHSAEIDRMTAAIRRDGDGILWTAEMRAITRGGKCLVAAAEDEPDSI
jgi:predicted deacylase